MSWDKTCLRLQEFRVNAYLEDTVIAAAGLSGLSVTGGAERSDASSWGLHPCLMLLSLLCFLLEYFHSLFLGFPF